MSERLGRMKRGMLAAAAIVTCMSMGGAGQADEVRIGLASPASTLDPHFHNLTPNKAVAAQIYEALFEMDDNSGRLLPGLAKSWRMSDGTTWEIDLQDGVTFSDGSPFTANDVVYTICRIPTVKDSPGSFMGQILAIASVEAPAPNRVVIRTKSVYPLLAVDLSDVPIISAKAAGVDKVTYAAEGCPGVESLNSADFNSGKLAIGTGPFKPKEFVPGDRIVLDRNEKYRGKRPDWDRAVLRVIPNDVARVAALLSGEVQLIEKPPLQDIDRIEKQRGLTLSKGISERVIYLAFDFEQEPTPGVRGTNGKNPLKDLRVRQAVSHAVDRKLIVDRVMRGQAVAAGQLMSPGTVGFDPSFKPDAYDPEKAKKLLAEAGYPNGFELTIGASNNRYVNDARIAETVAQMLTRVGIRTSVETANFSVFSAKRNKYEYSFYLGGWGNGTREGIYTYRSLVATRDTKKGLGSSNRGRYHNPKVDALLEEATMTLDEGKRTTLFKEIETIVKADAALLPIHYEMSTWAHQDNLVVTTSPDQKTLAQRITKKR